MGRLPMKNLIEKEGIATILFLVICVAFALWFPPGIGTSNQAPSVGHAAAPWIFGPIQILLLYFPPWLSAVVFPFMIIAGIASLPWLVDLVGVKWGQRIFFSLFGIIVVLLIWFTVKELWWT